MKRIAFLALWCAHALLGQTINPNQIRPATADNQVLTTVTANQPASWQPAAGISIATTSPCTVNGGTGPVSSGTATITCAGGFQMAYTPPGTGQHVLVPATTVGCTGSGDQTCTIAGFSLPSYVVPADITAVYAVAISQANMNSRELEAWHVGGNGSWTGDQFNLVPNGIATGVWSLSQSTAQATILPTNYAAVNFEWEACCSGTGLVSVSFAALDIYYTGTAPPASNSLLVQAPLSYSYQTNTLSLSSPFNAGFDFGAVNAYQVNVPLITGPNLGDEMELIPSVTSTSTAPTVAVVNAASSGAITIVNQDGSALSAGQLVADVPTLLHFDGTKWRIVGGSNGITALTGDVSASGSGSVAATVTGLKSVPFCTGFTPTTGQVLEYTTGSSPNPCYTAATPSGGFTAGGDLSGTSTSQEVVGLYSVPFCTGFTPTNGQAIEYTTGSSPNPCYTAATPSGGAPSGTGVPQVVSGAYGTTVDMGTTAGVPLVSNGSHGPQLANGLLVVGGSGPNWGVTWPEGADSCTTGTGTIVLCTNSTLHTLNLSANGSTLSPICTAANGECTNPTLPSESAYSYVPDAGSVTSISASVTVTANVVYVVAARYPQSSGVTVSDTLGNSWTSSTGYFNSDVGVQQWCMKASSSGADTITSTQSSAAAGLSMVIMPFSNLSSCTPVGSAGATNYTTSALTTSARSVLVYCVGVGALTSYPLSFPGAGWYSAGVSSSAVNSTNADQGCAYSIAPGLVFGTVAPLTVSGSNPASNVVAYPY